MTMLQSFKDRLMFDTELDNTQELLATTNLVGPLAPAFSEALNEVFSTMPSTVDGSSATDMVTESQQISSVQQRKLIESIPKDFGKGTMTNGLNTTIYAVRRSGVKVEDVANIGDRFNNIARAAYGDTATLHPLIVVLDVDTNGDVSRYTNEVTEGMALAVETMAKCHGIPVVNNLASALRIMARK